MTNMKAEEIKRFYGIAEPGEEANFIVPPSEYQQISYDVVSERRYSIPLPTYPLFLAQILRPYFLPCLLGFEPWCWAAKYKSPLANFLLNAIGVKDVTVYLLRGRITGRVETNFGNMSTEGETWEENERTGEQRNRRAVEGSADLSGQFNENLFISRVQERLADVANVLSRTRPRAEIRVESPFEKTGYMEMIKTIVDILKTGSVDVDDSAKATLSYSWMGKAETIERDIKILSRLPVRNLSWKLW